MIFRVSRLTGLIFFSFMLGVTGCGVFKSANPGYGKIPLSNATAAEKALEQAFLNSGIPSVNDSAKYGLIIRNDKNGMMASTAAGYLFSKGWNLNVKQSGFPAVSISLDTVSVRIASIKTGKVKSVYRKAEAKISIEIHNSTDSKRVYTGTGTYEDNPPAEWVKSNREDEDFVSYSSGFRKTSSFFVPVLYSITGTVIIWLFYSYRN